MNKLTKIGIVVAVVGLVVIFIVSPLVAYQQTTDIASQLSRNLRSLNVSPGSTISLNYNGKTNDSVFVLVYNTSSLLPLQVAVSPSAKYVESTQNGTFFYYLYPSEGQVSITNNQTKSQMVFYSYGYLAESGLLLIEVTGYLGFALLVAGAAVGVLGFFRGRFGKRQA